MFLPPFPSYLSMFSSEAGSLSTDLTSDDIQ